MITKQGRPRKDRPIVGIKVSEFLHVKAYLISKELGAFSGKPVSVVSLNEMVISAYYKKYIEDNNALDPLVNSIPTLGVHSKFIYLPENSYQFLKFLSDRFKQNYSLSGQKMNPSNLLSTMIIHSYPHFFQATDANSSGN